MVAAGTFEDSADLYQSNRKRMAQPRSAIFNRQRSDSNQQFQLNEHQQQISSQYQIPTTKGNKLNAKNLAYQQREYNRAALKQSSSVTNPRAEARYH